MFNHNKTCLLQALFYILCSNCVCVIGIEILNAIRFTTLHTNCLCSHATFKFSSKVYMAAHKRCFVFTSLCFCFLVGIERFFVFFFFCELTITQIPSISSIHQVVMYLRNSYHHTCYTCNEKTCRRHSDCVTSFIINLFSIQIN